MQEKKGIKEPLVVVFLLSAFFMKLVSEFVHEVIGHGLFVMLLGGTIRSVYISVLWPYELSHIQWTLPPLEVWQRVWLYSGGIIATGALALVLITYLLVKSPDYRLTVIFSWLAFWCLMNAAGYLVIGGLHPFGDIAGLMNLNVISSAQSLGLGIGILVMGFIALSHVQRKALFAILGRQAAFANIVMWTTVPVVTSLAAIGMEVCALRVLMAGVIPPVLSVLLELRLLRVR